MLCKKRYFNLSFFRAKYGPDYGGEHDKWPSKRNYSNGPSSSVANEKRNCTRQNVISSNLGRVQMTILWPITPVPTLTLTFAFGPCNLIFYEGIFGEKRYLYYLFPRVSLLCFSALPTTFNLRKISRMLFKTILFSKSCKS